MNNSERMQTPSIINVTNVIKSLSNYHKELCRIIYDAKNYDEDKLVIYLILNIKNHNSILKDSLEITCIFHILALVQNIIQKENVMIKSWMLSDEDKPILYLNSKKVTYKYYLKLKEK